MPNSDARNLELSRARTRRERSALARVATRKAIEKILDGAGPNGSIQADHMEEIYDEILEEGNFDMDVDREDIHRALKSLHSQGIIRVTHSGSSYRHHEFPKRHRIFLL